MLSEKTANKTFSFVTNSVEYEEVNTKSSQEFYVKGYISTDEIDRANEIVTREAMANMMAQIKAGNVKLDVEHSTFAGDNSIPVGRIVDAGIDNKGLWVKAVLYKSHEKFDTIWKSIKDGFLDAFSIAYKVKEFTKSVIDGVNVTLLKALELLNVAITGNPVCRGAKMTESFAKSVNVLMANTGEKMTDETTEPIAPPKDVVEPVTEPAPAEPVIPAPEPAPEPEPTPEPEPAPEPEPIPEPEPEPARPLDQIKSIQSALNKEKENNIKLKAEISALKKELDKPIMKGVAATDIAEVKDDAVVFKSPFQVIR